MERADLELIVDLDSPVPLFEQLRVAIEGLVVAGRLPSGYRLPAVRALAAELGIAPGTVARVYRTLHGRGVLTASRGAGTRVADAALAPAAAHRARLDEAAMQLVLTGRRHGAGDEDIRASLARALSAR